MTITYEHTPVEGRPFSLRVDKVVGTARFKFYIGGDLFLQLDCDDPPCHEEALLPGGISGQTLLVEVTDSDEQQELTFFINDDGKGVPVGEPKVRLFAST